MKFYHVVFGVIIGFIICCIYSMFAINSSTECCILPSCEIEKCAPLKELYKPGEVIITYPSIDSNSMPLPIVSDSIVKVFLDSIIDIVVNVQRPSNFRRERPIIDTLERCVCGRNIFIYKSDAILNQETELAQTTPRGADPEGPKVSPNYWIQDSNDNPDMTLVAMQESIFAKNDEVSVDNDKDQITVAILDSGIKSDLIHPIFKRSWTSPLAPCSSTSSEEGWNFIDNNGLVDDINGHGVMVTQSYLEGLEKLSDGTNPMPPVKILPVKVLDGCGRGSMYSVLCGLYYAHSQDADIANLSLGIYQNDVQLARAFSEVTCDNKMKLVCSAGNKSLNLNDNEHFPSAYARYDLANPDGNLFDMTFVEKNTFEVGGLCIGYDNICGSLSQSMWTGSNYVNGMFVESATNYQNMIPGGEFTCSLNGTSYAAPQFAAGLTYALSIGPSGNIKNVLRNSSRTITDERGAITFNYGSYISEHCN